MCGSNLVENVAIAATGGLAAPVFMQKKMIKKQEAAQAANIATQTAKDDALRVEAEKLGPAARSIDLTKEASAYEELKKNKTSLRAGLMGTIKTSSLNSAPTAAVQKTTLGS